VLYSTPQILYVDSDESCRGLVRQLLESPTGYEVTTAGTVEEALELMAARTFDLYIFDQPWRDPVTALELCRCIRQKDGKTPVLILSVLPHEADRNEGLAAGANEYLVKPDDIGRLPETAGRLLQKKMVSRGNF
jgi:DNA-binding response OmpR family regulator